MGLRLYVKAFRGFSCRSTNSGKRPFVAPEFFLVSLFVPSRFKLRRARDIRQWRVTCVSNDLYKRFERCGTLESLRAAH